MLALRQCWIVGAATFGLIPRTLLKCDATGASSSWCLFHKSASRIDLSLLSEENVSKCMFVSIIKTQGLANSIIFLIYIYIFSGLLGFCLDSKPLWMMERDCFYFFSFFFYFIKVVCRSLCATLSWKCVLGLSDHVGLYCCRLVSLCGCSILPKYWRRCVLC